MSGNDSDNRPRPIRGRGAAVNPPNRFEAVRREADWEQFDGADDFQPFERSVATEFLLDRSQTIIARNDSPDIPFTYSINPYRGCEHGCAYCLAGDTPILMADGTIKALAEVRPGDAIYGTLRKGWCRRYVKTLVLAHWSVEKPAYRVALEDGTTLIAGGDHRFLTDRGWKFVAGSEQGANRRPQLTPNNKLMGVGAFAFPPCMEGQAVKNAAHLRVVSVDPLGLTLPLFDITTGTGDFIANGIVSHNCYARPTHETLGMNAGLDFESKVLVKFDAAKLLRKELNDPKWTGETISVSGVTDCYQPAERKFRITRGLLEVMDEANQPLGIVTKNALVMRDLDLLAPMAARRLVHVYFSVTTLDAELARRLEPRTAAPAARLRAMRELSAAGVPVGVMVAPVIPGLNDHQVPQMLEAAAAAGARSAGYVLLRLPLAVEPIFLAWLESHYPLVKPKVEGLLRAMRSGELYQGGFGRRMRGEGPYAESLKSTFRLFAKKYGLEGPLPELDSTQFRPPRLPGGQGRLF